jgi:hypothetical protein
MEMAFIKHVSTGDGKFGESAAEIIGPAYIYRKQYCTRNQATKVP